MERDFPTTIYTGTLTSSAAVFPSQAFFGNSHVLEHYKIGRTQAALLISRILRGLSPAVEAVIRRQIQPPLQEAGEDSSSMNYETQSPWQFPAFCFPLTEKTPSCRAHHLNTSKTQFQIHWTTYSRFSPAPGDWRQSKPKTAAAAKNTGCITCHVQFPSAWRTANGKQKRTVITGGRDENLKRPRPAGCGFVSAQPALSLFCLLQSCVSSQL